MKKTFGNKKFNPDVAKEFRINEKIFASELIIIDENGENLGSMNKDAALAEALERGFDLVEVSPKANPPIAKFMNYGSFRYQQEKMKRKARAKQKTVEVKTVKISTNIGQHDLAIRIAQAIKFLNNGDKVKIELQLRGREHQHADLAKETIKKTIDGITTGLEKKMIRYEQVIQQLGSKVSTIISLS